MDWYEAYADIAGERIELQAFAMAAWRAARAEPHEKGGIEGEAGYFRRNHWVPVPEAADVADMNRQLLDGCQQDERRLIAGREQTVGAGMLIERDHLLPLARAKVHHGQAPHNLAHRQLLLDAAYSAHPQRFVRKPPRPPELPSQAWINRPPSEGIASFITPAAAQFDRVYVV